MTNKLLNSKKHFKKKILFYCDQLGISPPKEWSKKNVFDVCTKINKSRIIHCKYCHKPDVRFPHECDPNRTEVSYGDL